MAPIGLDRDRIYTREEICEYFGQAVLPNDIDDAGRRNRCFKRDFLARGLKVT